MKKNKKNVLGIDKQYHLLTNLIIILQLVLGTLPLLFVVTFIDYYIRGKASLLLIVILGGISILVAFIRGYFYGVSIWQTHKTAYDALTKIRLKIIEHLQKLPIGFFQNHKQGNLANIMRHDVEQIEIYLAHGLPEILSTSFLPFVIWIIIMIIEWRLGLALISLLPFAFLLQWSLKKIWKNRFKQFSESTKRMSEDLLEYVATISTIKAFSNDENRTEKLLSKMEEYIRWVKSSMLSIALPMSVITMFFEGGLVIMTIVGIPLIVKGDINITTFIFALILGGLFSASFAKMATFQHIKVIYNQSVDNVRSILDAVERVQFNKNVSNIIPSISFKNVSFTYPSSSKKERKAIDAINFTIKPYSKTALIGESGSGKTTIAHIIMGFWEVQSGEVLIGDKNIKELSEKNISELFSIVEQNVFLFNVSIKENIRMGNPSASMQEIKDAAEKAQIHDFIMGLPQGYETIVGEAGVKFSGGEKQRISIARMILKDTPFVILDEATAALDKKNEQKVQIALNELQKKKTVITVAHRLNTIKTMSSIIVMKQGKILANGTHKNLISNVPLYKEMIEKQELVSSWKLKEEIK